MVKEYLRRKFTKNFEKGIDLRAESIDHLLILSNKLEFTLFWFIEVYAKEFLSKKCIDLYGWK